MPLRRALLTLILTAFAGCRDARIERYTIPKSPPGSGAPVAALAAPPSAGGLSWTAPERWKARAAGGMRAASYAVPGPEGAEADFSVVVLPGPAGGGLANVNRWRGQLGLAPIDAAGMEASSARIAVQALGGDLRVVDLSAPSSPAERTVGAIFEAAGKTWFFKLTGPDAAVAGAKTEFVEFLKSLRSDAP